MSSFGDKICNQTNTFIFCTFCKDCIQIRNNDNLKERLIYNTIDEMEKYTLKKSSDSIPSSNYKVWAQNKKMHKKDHEELE
jgi:hypothetical protein